MNSSVCFSDAGMLWKFQKKERLNFLTKQSSDTSGAYVDFELGYIFCPYEFITAFDLQLERTLADRDRIPLLRLTVELSDWPVVFWDPAGIGRGRAPVAGRLMLAWMTLSDASLLEGYLYEIQTMRRAAGAAVTMVLPSWVTLMQAVLPVSLYSPGHRRAVERLVVVWMLLSGLWALWQLYQHVDMFAAALRPVVRVLVSHFGRVVRVRPAPSAPKHMPALRPSSHVCPAPAAQQTPSLRHSPPLVDRTPLEMQRAHRDGRPRARTPRPLGWVA